MRAFLCHTSRDSAFVIETAKHLKRSLKGVFYFEDYQRADFLFQQTINEEIDHCQVMIIFVGEEFTEWQIQESLAAHKKYVDEHSRYFFTVLLPVGEGPARFPSAIRMMEGFPIIKPDGTDSRNALDVAAEIVKRLGLPFRGFDDLPLNEHLFSYEKDIIEFFDLKSRLGPEVHEPDAEADEKREKARRLIREKILNGCPSEWPDIVHWERAGEMANELENMGKLRPDEAGVVTTALQSYFTPSRSDEGEARPAASQLYFPEAGPRISLYFPVEDTLHVAVLVSGGIAPGINAVIDGIVQRHWQYAEQHGYSAGLTIFGLLDGFRAFDNFVNSHRLLAATQSHFRGFARRLETSNHANEGGSILGTSRVDELININSRGETLQHIDQQLLANNIDILYIIGGDGSMKAAHALWSVAQSNPHRKNRPLSVVAIPKTMDNDILWMWQSFGHLSAVEKAREVIENLNTEVTSNPRLCVVQLFGSDSGFVISHAVLASATGLCSLALIPEVPFSMQRLAEILRKKIIRERQPIPRGVVVMAETAIPVDAMNYTGKQGEAPLIDIGLSEEEKNEIRTFEEMRRRGIHIQGQTNDALRTAGLKIVSRGLQKLLPSAFGNQDGDNKKTHFQPNWSKFRVFTNEPRHLLRAIPPSCSDIIIGHRLGTLAVDNAMAGYTDFMISQWLTEYVLVPLKLVVLGRKRIPTTGIFWKSVLAKTGQPDDLT